jgi:hypothetical protein
MRTHALLVAVAVACLAGTVDAHFALIQPAASMIQNRLGDPQKIGPCGGVSANPARNQPANPGVPSGAVTNVKGGTKFPLLVQETIFHPGHYRIAMARTAAELPKDPVVTTKVTEQGTRSEAAEIMNPPVAPILADGLWVHTERPMNNWETEIDIPNVNGPMVLQVIQVMFNHPGIAVDGGFTYHHCANLNITADPSKPLDTRWGTGTR